MTRTPDARRTVAGPPDLLLVHGGRRRRRSGAVREVLEPVATLALDRLETLIRRVHPDPPPLELDDLVAVELRGRRSLARVGDAPTGSGDVLLLRFLVPDAVFRAAVPGAPRRPTRRGAHRVAAPPVTDGWWRS